MMGMPVSIFGKLIISLASTLAELVCLEVRHSWSRTVDGLVSLISNWFGFCCHYYVPNKAHKMIYKG